MRQLVLELADRSYNIHIDKDIISQSQFFQPYCEGENVLILSNEVVAPLYLKKLSSALNTKRVHHFILPDGEKFKSLENYSAVLDFLIEHEFRRNDTLIALGGGVIGDLGGFVAASYQRGMGFIQVPTTLLAQVDSSVGGKTAVNHTLGKNMIGAFYQPKVVVIDTATLQSLPEREYVSGFAEVVKYAMLGEENILALLSQQMSLILKRDPAVLAEIIFYSCQKKASVVSADEIEQGNRALLNLGHTFGHAIERITQYNHYLHGEAIAIGTAMALNLAISKRVISEKSANFYRLLFSQLGLPLKLNYQTSVSAILDAMKLDKKNMNEKIRLILPNESGCIIVEEHDMELLSQAIVKQLD